MRKLNSDVDNATMCMNILINTVGLVDAERFIAYVNRQWFDYTIWRRQIYDGKTSEEIEKMTSDYMRDHPIPDDVRKRIESYREDHPYDRSSDPGNLRSAED